MAPTVSTTASRIPPPPPPSKPYSEELINEWQVPQPSNITLHEPVCAKPNDLAILSFSIACMSDSIQRRAGRATDLSHIERFFTRDTPLPSCFI